MSGNLSFKVGSRVELHGKACTVTATVDVTKVLVRFDDGDAAVADVVNLTPLSAGLPRQDMHPDAMPEKDLAVAQARLQAIRPLLGLRGKERGAAVAEHAAASGCSRNTLYRWLKAYEGRRLLSDLAPQRPKTRQARLTKAQEAVVRSVIEDIYLNKQQRTQKAVFDAVKIRCRAAKIKAPGRDAIRKRILEIDEREKLKRRRGAKAARDDYDLVQAKFPGATYPLAVVQIDHTPLDIELVDDESRQPIGRPWLTLAIDVFSRMVTGYYLSLDAPSAFSVGMCIRHSVLDKSAELTRLGVEGEWPVWGVMRVIHADNGKDFRSETIQRACDQYDIRPEWRPVRTPHWGGHIERMLGTLAKEIHALPGTTFSNIRQKGVYESEKMSAMTITDLNKWLVTLIVGVYHARIHKGIGKPPLARWQEGILGHGRHKGIGLPDPVADPHRFRLDFLPYTERTVQREGIAWDNVCYSSPALRPWVNAKKGGRKVTFQVRRDPRDISRLYFLDPKLGDYLEVPYHNISRPSISLWELRAATKYAREMGTKAVNEPAIFAALQAMNRIEEEATKSTRKSRREQQRRKLHTKGLAHDRRREPATEGEPEPGGLRLVVDNKTRKQREPAAEEVFEFTEDDLRPKGEEWT